MHDSLYASFADSASAQAAASALLALGVDKEDLSLIGPAQPASTQTASTTSPGKETASGVAAGASVGLAVGALGAFVCLLIPGFGVVLGGGALATALAATAGTAAAGALTGGVTAFLQDRGVEAEVAQAYEQHISGGGSLLEVHLPDDDLPLDAARRILEEHGATDIRHTHLDPRRGVGNGALVAASDSAAPRLQHALFAH